MAAGGADNGCNPCCCWRLKDAAVTIGIWSTIFCIIQLGIFGWQMAAIKYEKDRAANTLLPNYNTYGRYDIPSYYESYWQSPEERYYTGLFVIQILCLIASFFLLFASIMLIYGVHTWSRYLVWPWFICMASSILTSLAYCIMWWAGDVRDYWLVLTILQIFAVMLNCYCFVVICVFYKRMLIELEYYEGKRANKYDRFNQRDTPQNTIEQDMDDDDDFDQRRYPQQPYPTTQGRRGEWDDWRGHGGARNYGQQDLYKEPPPDPHYPQPILQQPQLYPQYPQQKSPYFPQKFDQNVPRDFGFSNMTEEPLDPLSRPRSALATTQSVPSVFEDFKDVPRQQHRRSHRHRSSCRHCEPHRSHHHHHRRKRHHKTSCSSDVCSLDYSGTESTSSHHYVNKKKHRHSDNESDVVSELTDRKYRGSKRKGARVEKKTRSAGVQAADFLEEEEDEERKHKVPTTPAATSSAYPAGGISIPQHIVIPPSALSSDKERKYQINSEITISYDPRRQPQMGAGSPISPHSSQGTQRRNQVVKEPMSITSNV